MPTPLEKLKDEMMNAPKWSTDTVCEFLDRAFALGKSDSEKPVECYPGCHQYQTISEVNKCVKCWKDCIPVFGYYPANTKPLEEKPREKIEWEDFGDLRSAGWRDVIINNNLIKIGKLLEETLNAHLNTH